MESPLIDIVIVGRLYDTLYDSTYDKDYKKSLEIFSLALETYS
jgi:hypothetical protein